MDTNDGGLGLRTQTDTTVLNPVKFQKSVWPDSPRLYGSVVISMKFKLHRKRLCWGKGTLAGACLCLPPTTVMRHVVVLKVFTSTTMFKKCGVKLARESLNATS